FKDPILNFTFFLKSFKFGSIEGASGSKSFGLSMEDKAARLLTILGIYIPQGIASIHKDQHKWETNGRNALVWTMTLFLTILVKNDKYSVNTFLNHFMANKNEISTQPKGAFKKLMAPFGIKGDYFKILESAGIKFDNVKDRAKAFWSSLDDNKMSTIVEHYQYLKTKIADKKTLTTLEKEAYELVPQFLNRRNLFNLTSTGIISVLTMFVIGKVAMDLVFHFIAPLDHDYDPTRFKKDKPGNNPNPTPNFNRLPQGIPLSNGYQAPNFSPSPGIRHAATFQQHFEGQQHFEVSRFLNNNRQANANKRVTQDV
ncbi:MAG: hypothetical protein K2X66_11825, partial [Cyanobacteria bacterium]|nr:hypothetical protein [Cyanobacteriota bacterium]